MKLLITGGAGFIGSNFIHYLLRKYPDYEIINLYKLTYAENLENLRDIEKNPHYRFIQGDIRDEKIVNDIVQTGIDVIVNYAAETHVDRSITRPRDFVETDVLGTFTLLEAAKKIWDIKIYSNQYG
jgi:dTDP-glucose 4,6-dehydratase